jgi:hypothetical protein
MTGEGLRGGQRGVWLGADAARMRMSQVTWVRWALSFTQGRDGVWWCAWMGAMSGRLWPDVRTLAALFFIWLAINGRSSCQVWAAPSYFLPVFWSGWGNSSTRTSWYPVYSLVRYGPWSSRASPWMPPHH